jgi:dipeptidyl aminopeptidase/acylaminoacyl peptidase
MSQLSKNHKWTTALAVVLAIASTVITSADSRLRDAVALVPIAYTQYYCYDGDCGLTRVVTPNMETAGPADSSPTWSPDAARVAFVRSGDVAVMDAAAGTVVNITNTASAEWGPAWSPNGHRIAFLSDRDGQVALYLMDPDGSDVARVTTSQSTAIGRPTWSPDSTRVAFSCQVDVDSRDICAINTDGTAFLRLTDDPAYDSDPAWSPDGSTIAFATTRYGGLQLAFMGPDGNDVAPVGYDGWQPAWSPDGRQIAFNRYDGPDDWGLHTVHADGTNPSFLASNASEAAWMPTSLFASFDVTCSGLTCTFDATDFFGNISAYTWSFGDQTIGAGDVVSHTYAVGGQKTIDLTVTDAGGATATRQQVISVNQPPVASFTVTCNDVLTCLFDWSGSYDPDGWLTTGGTWSYGGSVSSVSRLSETTARVTYAAPGTYAATLQVSDNDGASATASQTFTLATPFMHVGDIDRATTTQKGKWSATVTISVHSGSHQPVANALVTASWSSGGAVSCTTNAAGSCAFTKSNLTQQATLTLTVTNVQKALFVYQSQGNHDPDGDSNGTTVTISK